MESQVAKMYENAGVKFIIGVQCRAKKGDGCKSRCPDCDYNTKPKEYPPFTAEKQIELIKFLFNHNVYYDVNNKGNYWFHITDDCYTYYYSKFEIALANIINEMWQDLTEEEKQEIKRILGG